MASAMTPAINDVPRVDLEIHQGTDISFEFQWWLDDDGMDPQPLSAAGGRVKLDTTEEEVVLDFADYVSITDNGASVVVPGTDTALIEPFTRGVWDFWLEASTGERRKVARGNARCHREV